MVEHIGKLLGLPMHYIEASATDSFEDNAETACGLRANAPPAGALQGYDATHDLALTTDWERVTCDRCRCSN